MEPAHYFRILRLRWKALVLCVVMGALVGLGLTWLANRAEADEATYWLANHKLIVSDAAIESGRYPNLMQTSLLVTGGAIPETVAAAYDEDETSLTKRIRTVANSELSVIEISAVGTDKDETAELADTFAAELVTFLGADELARWEASVVRAEEEVDSVGGRLEELERSLDDARREIALLEAAAQTETRNGPEPGAEPVELTVAEIDAELERVDRLAEVRDTVGTLEIERASRLARYDQALADLDKQRRQGPPASLFETLDVIPPYEIGKSAYDKRIREGRRGQNNLNARENSDGGSGGLNLRERVSNPFVGAGVGMFGALFLGIGAVLVHMRVDPRLRTKAQVEEAFGLPVLAEVPKFSSKSRKDFELDAVTRPRSIVTESYRVVRSALLFARSSAAARAAVAAANDAKKDDSLERVFDLDGLGEPGSEEMRVIMVTSPGPSEGKTTTTANLAVVLAESGYNVLVVNCDYRIPKLHQFFGLRHSRRRALATGIDRVTLVADVAESGPANPTAVVEEQRNLIRRARGRYDVILLDTAPLLATNDAQALLPVVDMVVLVASEGRTRRDGAMEAVDVLRRREANLAGVVMTGCSGFDRGRYYYKYRYGSYYNEAEQEPVILPRRSAPEAIPTPS